MRLQFIRFFCITALLAGFDRPALAGQPASKPAAEDFSSGSYDDVLRTLVAQLLDKDRALAQDAAVKMAKLGKHAVPVLVELINDNFGKDKGNSQVVYYALWTLAQIKSADALPPIFAVLNSKEAGADLKKLALTARCLETSEEGLAQLRKIASEDSDLQLRKAAYTQLSVVPEAWVQAEKLFVDALSSPDDEIRTLAARQCYNWRFYKSAAGKLIELAEKDACEKVRVNAMLALARMNVPRAVPAMVRVLQDEKNPAALRQQASRTINSITGIQFKDAAAMQKWWQNRGAAEYAKQEEPTAQGPETPTPAVPQPEKPQALPDKDDQRQP